MDILRIRHEAQSEAYISKIIHFSGLIFALILSAQRSGKHWEQQPNSASNVTKTQRKRSK